MSPKDRNAKPHKVPHQWPQVQPSICPDPLPIRPAEHQQPQLRDHARPNH